MKFTAILAATALATVHGQDVCDILPGMVSLDTQDNQCCGAAIVLVASGAIAGGMGGIIPGCLLDGYADFFPDGCTDCTGSNDAGITNCVDGKSPAIENVVPASVYLCCTEIDGVLCEASIVAGAGTGSGGMNGQVIGGFDGDNDGHVDLCADVPCGTPSPPTPSPPTSQPTNSPPTNSPTPAPPTNAPTAEPTASPTMAPPTLEPTLSPTPSPTVPISGASSTSVSMSFVAGVILAGVVAARS